QHRPGGAQQDALVRSAGAIALSARPQRARVRRRTLAVLAPIVLAPALVLSGGPGGGAQRAAGQPSAAEATAQTPAPLPATGVRMMGSARQEAPGETWGIGKVQSQGQPSWAIVRYAEGAGWSLAPMLDAQGAPLSTFAPAGESSLAGQMTASGAGALLGAVT